MLHVHTHTHTHTHKHTQGCVPWPMCAAATVAMRAATLAMLSVVAGDECGSSAVREGRRGGEGERVG